MHIAPIVACLANVLPGLAGRHQARTILDHQDSAEYSRRNRDALFLNSRPPSIPLCRCCMTEPNHDLVYSRHVLEHLIQLKLILVTTLQRVRVLSKRMRTSNLRVTQPVAAGIQDEGEVEEVTRLDPTLRRGKLLIKDCRNLVGPDTIYDFNILGSEDRPKPDVNLDGHFLYFERTSIGCGETLAVGPIPPLHRPEVYPQSSSGTADRIPY